MSDIEKDFVSFGVNILESMGVDKVTSTLYWILFINPEEMSIDELAKKTGYSIASISVKMRLLLGIGMVEKRNIPRTKKIAYYVEKNIFSTYKKKFEIAYNKEIKPAKETLPSIIEKYKTKKLSKREEAQLKIVENYYNCILKLENLITKMQNSLNELK